MKKPSYNDLVFINCPFDDEYMRLFRAIVYAVYSCGFYPVSALAESNGLQNRIDKIVGMIEQCRYGIHDISRIDAGAGQLPRFNMPFELGLFFGANRYGDDKQRKKNAIVFEEEKYQYRRYLSDISGIDIYAHEGSPFKIIRYIRNWLMAASKNRKMPTAYRLERDYFKFSFLLHKIVDKLEYKTIEEVEFNDYCQIVEEAIRVKVR